MVHPKWSVTLLFQLLYEYFPFLLAFLVGRGVTCCLSNCCFYLIICFKISARIQGLKYTDCITWKMISPWKGSMVMVQNCIRLDSSGTQTIVQYSITVILPIHFDPECWYLLALWAKWISLQVHILVKSIIPVFFITSYKSTEHKRLSLPCLLQLLLLHKDKEYNNVFTTIRLE